MRKADFESKLHLDKIRHEHEVRGTISDHEMALYYIIMAQIKKPSEIWAIVPDKLRGQLEDFIKTGIKGGPDKKTFVGGPFEVYWDHSLVLLWSEFLSQPKTPE